MGNAKSSLNRSVLSLLSIPCFPTRLNSPRPRYGTVSSLIKIHSVKRGGWREGVMGRMRRKERVDGGFDYLATNGICIGTTAGATKMSLFTISGY